MKENARKKTERDIAREKRKQAMLDKALAAVQIGINTAVNISKVIPNPVLIALVSALGAAQLAAVASTPIPAYELGTDFHKGGKALVGEVRPEVIQEPGKDPYIVDRPSVLNLKRGTQVIPSMEEYDRLMRASILSSINISNNNINDFQARKSFNENLAILEKLDGVKKAVEKNKTNLKFVSKKPADINHELFRFNNTNWRG